jgi:hypothetical protein
MRSFSEWKAQLAIALSGLAKERPELSSEIVELATRLEKLRARHVPAFLARMVRFCAEHRVSLPLPSEEEVKSWTKSG